MGKDRKTKELKIGVKPRLAEGAIDVLQSYNWPGNVRELRNVIERAVVIARGKIIGAEELTFLDSSSSECRLGTLTLHEVEISHISAVLEACNWNVSRAAKQLGITTRTLQNKMQKYRKLGFVK